MVLSFIIFACACSTRNSKPFSTWFYFNNFVDVKFCGTGLYVFAACERLESMFLESVMFIFNNSCMADFH